MAMYQHNVQALLIHARESRGEAVIERSEMVIC